MECCHFEFVSKVGPALGSRRARVASSVSVWFVGTSYHLENVREKGTTSKNSSAVGSRMNAEFQIYGVDVVLHPLDMVSPALDQLGPWVGTLADQEPMISDAPEELLTRSWNLIGTRAQFCWKLSAADL